MTLGPGGGWRVRAVAWLLDETNRSLLLYSVATLLGLASVAAFVYSPDGSPTRFQFLLLLGSLTLSFLLSLRSSAY